MVTSVVRDDDGVREENIPWEQKAFLLLPSLMAVMKVFWNLHNNNTKGQQYVSLVFFGQCSVPFDILKCQGKGCPPWETFN